MNSDPSTMSSLSQEWEPLCASADLMEGFPKVRLYSHVTASIEKALCECMTCMFKHESSQPHLHAPSPMLHLGNWHLRTCVNVSFIHPYFFHTDKPRGHRCLPTQGPTVCD